MIKRFHDLHADKGFYLPSEAGPAGHIPKAPVGDQNKVETYKEFSEYRKGSDKFGGLVSDLMMFLRLYKDNNDKKALKFRIDNFVKDSKISIEKIKHFINNQEYKNLISFDIEIKDDFIIFKNLNDVYKTRYVWGENKIHE